MAHPNISPSDLEDLALELGAKLTRPDGSIFNVGGRSGVSRLAPPRLVPQAAPAEKPDANAELLAKVVELLSRPQPVAAAPEIVIPAPVVTVQAAPRVSWNFTFARNPDGTIKSITANPQE